MVHQTPNLQQHFCSMASGNQGAITPLSPKAVVILSCKKVNDIIIASSISNK